MKIDKDKLESPTYREEMGEPISMKNNKDFKKMWEEMGEPLTYEEFKNSYYWNEFDEEKEIVDSISKKDFKEFLKKAIKGSTTTINEEKEVKL